ncbi:unnamed protein product [Prorocentrum cordatum]|uniref:Uncharacterized protein n=1 Tax=Prorocentrum cordatum TaxID=2364126 RepID=A0ABN9QLI4_9DINO|nr:unnamed protein product [Polarella glacialis]
MPRGSPPRCICLSRNTEVVVEPCHADAAELAVGGAPRPREATRGAPPLARSGSGQQLHRLLRPSGAVGARLPIMQDPRVCERAAQQGLRRARGRDDRRPSSEISPPTTCSQCARGATPKEKQSPAARTTPSRTTVQYQ